jgi:hypothetical protein
MTMTATKDRPATKSARNEVLEKLALDYYKVALDARLIKARSSNMRKLLLAAMVRAGVKRFFTRQGHEVVIECPTVSTVDIEKLRKLVSAALFNRIVSATLKDVEALAGTSVMEAVRMPVVCAENVYVRKP